MTTSSTRHFAKVPNYAKIRAPPTFGIMVADVMVMLVAGLTIAIIAGAEVTPCPSDTVSVNLAATEDIQRLTDAMNCSGGGEYNVTWSNSLQLESRIKVSTGKHVTITGSSKTPAATAAPHHTHDNISIVDVGDISGIFLVSDNSTLTIHKMVLDGGYSEDGGAVAVISSSYLNVIDCVLTNNNASNGGAMRVYESGIGIDGNTSFFNNTSLEDGGAMYVYDSKVNVDGNSSVQHNKANGSGGKSRSGRLGVSE